MANFSNPTFETDLSGWIAGKSPNQITAGLTTGWWDASQITGYVDGQVLTTVTDASGNGNTLSQVGTGPTYKTGIRNGLPIMRFNDAHQLTSLSGLANSPSGDNDYAVFTVMSPTAQNDLDVVMTLGQGTIAGSIFFIYRTATGNWSMEWFGGPASQATFGAIANGSWNTLMGDSVSTLRTAYLNGAAGGSFTQSLGLWNWTTIGNLHNYAIYYTGDVAEHIITKGLTAQQKADIHSYLALKWNLPLTTQGAQFTRDTGTFYAGVASMKAVAVDATIIGEEFDPEGVGKLSAYAYTDGSPVTSADVELFYDTAAISTTYTSAGGGWYKLTGNFVAGMTVKRIGAIVKAGKTVYMDNFNLGNVVGPFPTFLP